MIHDLKFVARESSYRTDVWREKFIVIHIIEQEESEKYADQKYISKLYKYHVLISNFILSRSAGAPSGEARKPPFGKSLIN